MNPRAKRWTFAQRWASAGDAPDRPGRVLDTTFVLELLERFLGGVGGRLDLFEKDFAGQTPRVRLKDPEDFVDGTLRVPLDPESTLKVAAALRERPVLLDVRAKLGEAPIDDGQCRLVDAALRSGQRRRRGGPRHG
jgi:hypothetical protein